MTQPRRLLTTWVISLLTGLLLIPTASHAFYTRESSEPNKDVLISTDLLIPFNAKRDIHTINLSYSHFLARLDELPVSLYGGVTATYSRGDSTQVEDFDDGTFADIEKEESAFGLGPQLLARVRLLNHRALTVYFDGTANIILYNKRFPNNGERYNFLFRAGPVLEYRVGTDRYFGIGFSFAHVSNGQGEVPENPSYDAIGVTLNFANFF